MPTMTPALARADTTPTAACSDVDPELMFPLEESQLPGQRTPGEVAALAVCARCEIAQRCRKDVLEARMPYGVAGGMTAADRRAARARRRDQIASNSGSPAGGESAASSATGRTTAQAGHVRPPAGLDVDAAIAAVLAEQARFGHGADPARVAALLTDRGRSGASRWEAALAAVVAVRLGRSLSATARGLAEQYTTVLRWRDRAQAGEALVRGAAAASSQLGPSALTATPAQDCAGDTRGVAESSPGADRAASSDGASPVSERGAA